MIVKFSTVMSIMMFWGLKNKTVSLHIKDKQIILKAGGGKNGKRR